MKKILILGILIFSTANSFAQLTVDSLGRITMADEVIAPAKMVTVRADNSLNLNNVGFQSVIHDFCSNPNVAVLGESIRLNNGDGAAIGTIGAAGGSSFGYNYGIIGGIKNSNSGIGVLGLDNYVNQYSLPTISDRFAGYFKGRVAIMGNLFVNGSQITSSDIRLKENILPLSKVFERNGILRKILQVETYQYNFKDNDSIEKDLPGYGTFPEEESKKNHYGVIAQELEMVFPDLVCTNNDGVKAVNYTELIPILIQSIKELEEEVATLRGIIISK